MTDIQALVNRIDQEIAAEVKRQKTDWDEVMRVNRERGLRFQRCEAETKHIIELLKPRLDAFIERLKTVVKVEPSFCGHTRAVKLCFAATVAMVTLRFEVHPDQDASHIRLKCTQEIIPAVVRHDRQAVLEFPRGGVQDDVLVQWFDDRVVAFSKAYVAVVAQDVALRQQLKDQLVKDPVARQTLPVPRRRALP